MMTDPWMSIATSDTTEGRVDRVIAHPKYREIRWLRLRPHLS